MKKGVLLGVVFVFWACSMVLAQQSFHLTVPVMRNLYFVHCTFEQEKDGWEGDTWVTNTLFERDDAVAYSGQYSMHVFVPEVAGYLTIGVRPENWSLDRYPYVEFAYKIPRGTPVGLFFQIAEGDHWVCLGGTSAHNHGWYPANDICILIDDNTWHTVVINARDAIKSIDPSYDTIYEFEWWTAGNAQPGSQFWFDEFIIKE